VQKLQSRKATTLRSSAVVVEVTLWYLMGDTMATQHDEVSPESRAGRMNVSQTVAPREHLSGEYASGFAGFWHNLRKLVTSDFAHMFQYYSADADLLIQLSANQRLTRDQPYESNDIVDHATPLPPRPSGGRPPPPPFAAARRVGGAQPRRGSPPPPQRPPTAPLQKCAPFEGPPQLRRLCAVVVGQKRRAGGRHSVVPADFQHVSDERLDGERESAAGRSAHAAVEAPSAPAAAAPAAAQRLAVTIAAHPSQSFRSASPVSRAVAGAKEGASATVLG